MLQDSNIDQPTLENDGYGFTIKLPIVQEGKNEQFVYMGQKFPANPQGKNQIGRLFRAAVLHIAAHTLVPLPPEKAAPSLDEGITAAFAKTLFKDVYVNTYLETLYADRLVDVAYANALAYLKIKPVERIFSDSTKVMTALVSKINVGQVKGTLQPQQEQTVDAIYANLMDLKGTFKKAVAGEKVNLEEMLETETKGIVEMLEPYGPFLEAPSFKYTEQIGRCSIYSEVEQENNDLNSLFVQSLKTLGGTPPAAENIEECWRSEQEAEALQAFNSDQHQRERKEKILAKISPYIALTRFKAAEFPEEDYTQYLRAKSLVQGTSRRLLDALRSALNYLDEDPRQEMGQLDLSAVIQAMASNKPATDVFVLDEYLKQSFAWSIIVDVSSSMQVKGDYGRALAIAVAEAAKELMLDATSWTLFGFSDRFFILKDSSESYSQRVKARIGGLKFQGLTYIPDAVRMAGKMLAKRFEEQRVLVAISDGWPYGYENMPLVLKENVDDLLKKGVIVIGIGVETDRMGNFFRLSSSVYTPKDLVKKFGNLFADASAKALET